MKKLVCVIILCLSFAACGGADKPDGLLPPDKMSSVLVDVHLAEASIQTYKMNQKDSIAALYYGHIFRIHEVEEDAFYTSMEYYSHQPKIWQGIYERTVEILSEGEAKTKGKK